MRVLLVEDDVQLNTTIQNFLLFKNYSTTALTDGIKALEQIDANDYDLYIIDINIPNIDGLEIIRYIRNKDFVTPIIIITASLELQNFKTAFEYGCSEYIKKPFYLEELEIRIDNLMQNAETSVIKIAPNISYDCEYEELQVDNEFVKLRKKERRLLTLLLQNLNKTVKTQAIESYVWENELKDTYNLRQLVSDLRKKFNSKEKFIVSEIGIGYRFEIKK